MVAHGEDGPLQAFVAALMDEYAQAPPAMGLLAAHLCSLWASRPAAALAYLGAWERLLMYGGSSGDGPGSLLAEARPSTPALY